MLALETGGMTVLQYDRCGQGDSTGFVLGTPPDYDFPQRQSEMLQLLLNLVKVDPANTVLVGVGDGGAIALAHATMTEPALRGLVLMNPRLVMEQKTLDAMIRLKARRTEQLEEMHHHGDKAEALFDGYLNMWLSPPVVSMDLFDMRPLCKHLRCPTLVIHAANDEFTTAEAQVEPIEYFSPSSVEVHRMTTLAPGRLPFLKETRKKRSKVSKIVVSEEVVGLLARFSTSLFT
jgi:pimeloyl-ACP methyl ester carboxylesterase